MIKDELYLKCCTFSNTPIKEFIYSGCFIVLKASDIKWCLVYYTISKISVLNWLLYSCDKSAKVLETCFIIFKDSKTLEIRGYFE